MKALRLPDGSRTVDGTRRTLNIPQQPQFAQPGRALLNAAFQVKLCLPTEQVSGFGHFVDDAFLQHARQIR